MYLFIGFFNEDEVNRKRKYISEKGVKTIKKAFSNFMELNRADIKAAIGFFLGNENSQKLCFLVDINSIEASEENIIITFNNTKDLDKSSREISNEIYKKSWKLDWIDQDTGYYPLVLMVDKHTFNSIRKGSANIRKLSDIGEKVKDLKAKYKWEEICELYEPLEDVHKKLEIWNNPDELYEVGFACSKLGELQNGLEKDPNHLKKIKRYRDLSLEFYKRCYELEPKDYKYASSVAYRYYQNVNELSKLRGRRDGVVREEIENANKWFDISLNLYPGNIKDNYRKGKMIKDKQLKIARYSEKNSHRENSKEIYNLISQAIEYLNKAIQSYEALTDEDKKKRYRNVYIKSLYNLGKLYIDEVNINWNEFLCSKIGNESFSPMFYKLDYIVKGKELLEKCYKEVTGYGIDDELDLKSLTNISKKAATPPIDILYSIGLLYYKMYYIKFVKNNMDDNETYKYYAYKFMNGAIDLRNEFRKQSIRFKNTDYINYYLANLYIVDQKYNEAIEKTKRSRTSYIRNTYAAALILTDDKNNLIESRKILESVVKDRNNLSKSLSIALLAKVYQLTGYEKEKKNLIDVNNNESVDRLLELIL